MEKRGFLESWRGFAVLAALAPALIARCASSPFLPFDDPEHTFNNLYVMGRAPWSDVFAHTNGSIFPLTLVSFRLEHLFFAQMGGIENWAVLCRIDNLILHIVAAFLVWRILKLLKLSPGASWVATGLFLLSPLACESTCWVSERKNVQAAAFGFAAVFLAMRGRLVPAVLVYFVALFSKPAALGLLPVVVAIFSGRLSFLAGQHGGRTLRRWIAIACVIVAACAAIGLTLSGHSNMVMQPPGGSIFTALLTDAEIARRYMQNLFLPLEISVFYEVQPIRSPFDLRFFANAAVVFAVVAGTIFISRRRALILFLWFWFFAALGPVSNIVSIPFMMQDRYAYFAAPAFFAVIVLTFEEIFEHISAPANLRPALAAPIVLFAALSFARSSVWKSLPAGGFGAYALFSDAVAKQPNSAYANLYMGTTLIKVSESAELERKNLQQADRVRVEAIAYLEKCCRLPDFERLPFPSKPYASLAIAQFERGDSAAGEATLEKIRAGKFERGSGIKRGLSPGVLLASMSDIHQRIASIMLLRGNYAEALMHADKACLIKDLSESRLLRGEVLLKLGRIDDAKADFRRILASDAEYADAQKRLREVDRR